MPSKTVALTGASGFVGGHVLTHLLTAGHRVRALERQPDRFHPPIADATLRAVKGDLFDNNALAELLRGADAVIHIVGIIAERPTRGQTFERIHVQATANLLSAAQHAGVKRWVHMSALGTRPDALSHYHRTTWKAECAVRESGLAHTIFRPSIIHGPDGEFMELVKGFWCKRFPPFVPYFGAGPFGKGGGGRLQPVYVEDVARCFTEAVTNEKTLDETYPLGGPDRYTWPQLYEAVRTHLPSARNKKVVAVPAWYAKLIAGLPGVPFNEDQVIMSQEDSICETGKIEHHFGFKPARFEEALAQYANEIR